MTNRNINGVIVPLLTPINSDESVNYVYLDNLIEYVIQGGVDAILQWAPQASLQGSIKIPGVKWLHIFAKKLMGDCRFMSELAIAARDKSSNMLKELNLQGPMLWLVPCRIIFRLVKMKHMIF